MDKRLIRDLALAGGGITVGYLAGYLITKRNLKRKYQNLADAEIEQVKDRFKLLRKEGEFETAESAAEALRGEKTVTVNQFINNPNVLTEEEAAQFTQDGLEYAKNLKEHGYSHESTEEILTAVQERTTLSVFETKQPDPKEMEPGALHGEKIDGQPYVISEMEFMTNDDYDKITLNYFEADKTLCTDNEELIPDIERTVGVANMGRFGQGTDDPEVVYVRNERVTTDYEVTRDARGYTEVILGHRP